MNSLALGLIYKDRSQYCEAAGMIRAKEKHDLLHTAQLQELLSMEPEALVERLRQGIYHEKDVQDHSLEGVLGSLLEQEYREVEKYDHLSMAVPILRYRYDVHNLKVMIRKKFLEGQEAPAPTFVHGNHPLDELEDLLEGREGINFPETIGLALKEILSTDNPFPSGDNVDITLDLAWLEHGRSEAAKNRLYLISYYFDCLHDFTAIRHLWKKIMAARLGFRHGDAITPLAHLPPEILKSDGVDRLSEAISSSVYGPHLKEGLAEWHTNGSWALLDRDLDNFLIMELGRAKSISMGPEPLMAYLLAKEYDFKNIRLIYTFKKAGWKDTSIRKLLRRLYV